MIVLSNCLTDTADEGALKVANSLAKRIKQADRSVTVLSFRRRSSLTDIHMEINKMLLDRKLVQLIRKRREEVLYLPFPTRPLPNALRIFWLSLFSPKTVSVVLTMTPPHDRLSRLLLKLSRARLVALSGEAAAFYQGLAGKKRVTYLRTGVDTKRFAPVTPERKAELKQKYGLDPAREVVLHVGHMKAGRNVAQLQKLDSRYQILLVVSSFTMADQDSGLRQQLERCENIRILDGYLPDIQEIYQLADVYFFPVTEQGNCIDVPLSCLEAAACGVPVVTTAYGEMKEFTGKTGFYFLKDMDPVGVNALVHQAAAQKQDPRAAVLAYDWDHGVNFLLGR